MNKQECIEQLKDLRLHCADWGDEEPWSNDVQALDMAIEELKKTAPEVPVQEQLADLPTIDSEGIAIHYGRSIVSISKESTDYSFTE